jgi:hypothetical protein
MDLLDLQTLMMKIKNNAVFLKIVKTICLCKTWSELVEKLQLQNESQENERREVEDRQVSENERRLSQLNGLLSKYEVEQDGDFEKKEKAELVKINEIKEGRVFVLVNGRCEVPLDTYHRKI